MPDSMTAEIIPFPTRAVAPVEGAPPDAAQISAPPLTVNPVVRVTGEPAAAEVRLARALGRWFVGEGRENVTW